jgi:hypothetical protein
MKREPILEAGDIQYAVDALRVRINMFAAELRKDIEAAAVMVETSTKQAMSSDARVAELTQAAIAVRAFSIASDREVREADYDVLNGLGARLTELDEGDVVAAIVAMIACRPRI